MILVDTSVWIDHLRKGEPELEEALDQGRVITHDFVLGELACRNIRNRQEVLELLANLPHSPVATNAEVMLLIEGRSLMGRDLGFIDVHLLAASLLAEARLWTRDRRLGKAADDLHLGFRARG